MIIHDLEFFNSCDQESQNSDLAISGGASASSYVSAGDDGDNAYVTASVETDGGESYSIAVIGDKVIKKYGKGYSKIELGHYSASYETRYGVVSYSL
jgi:hypothetical protein